MVIRMGMEQIVSMAGATKVIPKRASGKRVHVATVYRWASVGLKGIRLETIQIGGHCYTSKEALGRFFAELTRQRESAERGGASCAPQGHGRTERELNRRLAKGRRR